MTAETEVYVGVWELYDREMPKFRAVWRDILLQDVDVHIIVDGGKLREGFVYVTHNPEISTVCETAGRVYTMCEKLKFSSETLQRSERRGYVESFICPVFGIPVHVFLADEKGDLIDIPSNDALRGVAALRDIPQVSDMVQHALLGNRGPVQQLIAEVALENLEELLRKNRDYGSSVFKAPVLAPEADAGVGIRVRMSDKIERLTTLLTTGSAEVAESTADTFSDLGNYCLLLKVSRILKERGVAV